MATFSNTATLRYNGLTRSSNTAVGEIVEVLSATKTPVNDTYARGDNAAYAISVQNAGTAPFTDVTLTDDLGAYELDGTQYTPLTYVPDSLRVFVDGELLTPAPTVSAGPPLVVGPLNVPAGANVMVLYEGEVNEFAPLAPGSVIDNTVTMTATGLTAPVTADAQTAVTGEPDLSINKSVSPTTVAENGTLTYTFVIENRGNTAVTETAGVQITDTFDPPLSNLSVTYNGAAANGADYSYAQNSGDFATTPGSITVPPATYTRAPDGTVQIVPGTATVTVTGTV